MTTASIGQEGFVWFIGKVEDRDDPLQLGRVKVRIMDFHPESKSLVPTDQLPWAQILLPSTNPSFEKVGLSPVGLTIGTTVFGFFIDGYDANQPVILGTTHGKVGNVSDVPDTSIGLNSVEKTFDSFEPKSAYAAQYPYNKTFRSEQGHVIEIDDTPNQERIHMYHKSGTYKEINKNGNQVDKIVGDHFEITLKNKVVHIKGDVAMLVDGSYTLESKGNMLFKAPRIDINPPGDSGVTSKATDLASEASAQAATGTQTTIVSSTTTSADVIEGSDATSDSVTGETGSDLGAQIAALFTSGTILGLISQAVEPMVAQEMKALGTFNVGEDETVSITASGGVSVGNNVSLTDSSLTISNSVVNSTAVAIGDNVSITSTSVSVGNSSSNSSIVSNLVSTTGSVFVGNSTVNASINSTSISFNGSPFSSGSINFKNLLINGDILVDQRKEANAIAGFLLTNSKGRIGFIGDRWKRHTYTPYTQQDISFNLIEDSPDNTPLTFCMDVAAAQANTYNEVRYLYGYAQTGRQHHTLSQTIVGEDLQHLRWGTSSAQPITLSFYAKSTQTGRLGLTYKKYAGDETEYWYATDVNIETTGSWIRYTHTLNGPTASSYKIKNDANPGLAVLFVFGGGGIDSSGTPNYVGLSSNTWTANGALDDGDWHSDNADDFFVTSPGNVQITGVQLEVGDTATDYETLPHDISLHRCRKYFQWKHHHMAVMQPWYHVQFTSASGTYRSTTRDGYLDLVPEMVGTANNWTFSITGSSYASGTATANYSYRSYSGAYHYHYAATAVGTWAIPDIKIDAEPLLNQNT